MHWVYKTRYVVFLSKVSICRVCQTRYCIFPNLDTISLYQGLSISRYIIFIIYSFDLKVWESEYCFSNKLLFSYTTSLILEFFKDISVSASCSLNLHQKKEKKESAFVCTLLVLEFGLLYITDSESLQYCLLISGSS